MKIFKFIVLLSVFISADLAFSQENSIVETKKKLSKLDVKINNLEKNLAGVNNKQEFLNKELAKISKHTNFYLVKLKKIDQNITAKNDEIKQLQTDINTLNEKLYLIQVSMAKYIAARYKLGEPEPLKWLLSQNNIQNAERLLTYYKYLVTTNKKIIDDLKSTKDELENKKIKLDTDLILLNNLQNQWSQTLKTLNNDKRYQATLISKMGKDIENKQKTLKSYRKDREDLAKLITSLTKKSVLQTKNPLTKMKKRLSKPIKINDVKIKSVNQGLMFYSPEGTEVYAISSGKVVFADWLNGYGLLIIVDHGWGFMSLYANNLSLFKRLGDNINTDEKIAKVGHSGVLPENGLYFEIRHHGKAISPLEWLK